MATVFCEEALATLIRSLSAVQAISTSIPVRTCKLAQTDDLTTLPSAVIVAPMDEEHENDLTGRGGGVTWTGMIQVCAQKFRDARLLMEAIRTNGTNPGTGLAGYAGSVSVTVGGSTGTFAFQMISLDKLQFSVVYREDGSDEAVYLIEAGVSAVYQETK